MVAGGVLDVTAAVPMIMGANIGTTITAMIVSLGSMKHPVEFERAFAASLLHLLFNLITVAVLFPLQASFDALTHVAEAGHGLFAGMGGMHLANPLKMATAPAIALLKWALFGNAILLLLVTIAMTYVALGGLVAMLRKLVLAKVEAFFDKVLFRDWRRAMAFGAVLTFAIQTSSVSTSLVNPLVGAGVLKVGQVFPFILGTNVGTTITAFLAALATGQRLPIIVAFTHVAFNIIGILIVWPFPPIRRIPLAVAQGVAAWAAGARYRPLAIIAVAYFVAPLILLFIVS
jgi:sodium-dependent phosphate cotransporter